MRIAIVLLLLVMVSCRPAADGVMPEYYGLSPEASQLITDGDTVPVRFTLVDNWSLGDYTISVQPDFDSLTRYDAIVAPFIWTWAMQIEGQTAFVDTFLVWPDSLAAGSYSFNWQVSDGSGNITAASLPLQVQSKFDRSVPVFDTIEMPDSAQVGSPLAVFFQASDSVALAYATVVIERTSDSKAIADTSFLLTGMQSMQAWQWPVDYGIGLYRVRIKVADWINNQQQATFNLFVYP